MQILTWEVGCNLKEEEHSYQLAAHHHGVCLPTLEIFLCTQAKNIFCIPHWKASKNNRSSRTVLVLIYCAFQGNTPSHFFSFIFPAISNYSILFMCSPQWNGSKASGIAYLFPIETTIIRIIQCIIGMFWYSVSQQAVFCLRMLSFC